MHALDQTTRATGDPTHNRWARELAGVAHRAFAYATTGSRRRMYWKVSVDLSRPLVSSMGQHDPLDGLVTALQLDATLRDSPQQLAEVTRDFAAMLGEAGLATTDPLGLGGLLADAFRLQQVAHHRQIAGSHELVAALLDAASDGIGAYVGQPDLRAPANRRLAFRELGLAIGLAGVRLLHDDSALTSDVRASLARCSRFLPIRDAIESFWLESAHRSVETWLDHSDINDVMLATSLCPEGFLVLRPPAPLRNPGDSGAAVVYRRAPRSTLSAKPPSGSANLRTWQAALDHFRIDGLDQLHVETRFPSQLQVVLRPVPGDRDELHVLEDGRRAHSSGDLVTVQSGQADVEQHDVRSPDGGRLERGLTVVGGPHPVPLQLQHGGEHGAGVHIVIDDEHAQALGAARLDLVFNQRERRLSGAGNQR
jgi:hypothetical protein